MNKLALLFFNLFLNQNRPSDRDTVIEVTFSKEVQTTTFFTPLVQTETSFSPPVQLKVEF